MRNTFLISSVQVETNSACNLHCWYCPHGWESRPIFGAMTVEQFRGIIRQCSPKVHPFSTAFGYVATSFYNESLMYPYYAEALDTLAEQRLHTYLLTNGTTIRDSMIPSLVRHFRGGTITCAYFNIPSGDRERWRKYTGGSDSTFDGMVDGMRRLLSQLPKESLARCYVQVNAVDLVADREGTALGENARNPSLDELRQDIRTLSALFGLDVIRSPLLDRAGILAERGVLTNAQKWAKPGRVVIGCYETNQRFRVDATGDVVLCCQDYRKGYVLGNVFRDSIADIWESQQRADVIAKARCEICRHCRGAETITEAGTPKVFVEIGTGRGDTLLSLVNSGWNGVVVEPLASNMEKLPQHPNVQYVQAAISTEDGKAQFHYFDPRSVEEGKVSHWGYGCGTLDPRFPLRQQQLRDHIRTITVETVTVQTLLNRCGVKRVDYLKIDAETWDGRILSSWPFDRFLPERIVYEHEFLGEDEKKRVIGLLTSHGYRLSRDGLNMLAERENKEPSCP